MWHDLVVLKAAGQGQAVRRGDTAAGATAAAVQASGEIHRRSSYGTPDNYPGQGRA